MIGFPAHADIGHHFFHWHTVRPHYDLNIAGPIGTPVVAPADGIVTLTQPLLLPGNTIILDHGHNLSSTFLHLSKISVKAGDVINKGEKSAKSAAPPARTWTGA